MFELKNNSDTAIHFRRPDLKLNFDLLPGDSYVITARQALALELYMNDMDLEITPSSANKPSDETQNVEHDTEAAVRGVAMSGLVDFNSQSIRPENRKDFYNNSEVKTDEDKVKVAEDNAHLAKKYELKSKKAKESIESNEAKAKVEDNIKKDNETVEKGSKNEPVTKSVDLGELVPAAGKDKK